MTIQSSTPSPPLRARKIADMSGRNPGPVSQTSHLRACKRFAAWLGRAPETATPQDVTYIQQHLVESGTSIGTRNQTMTGVKVLVRVTLRRHDLVAEIFSLREPAKVPLGLLCDWWKERPTGQDKDVPRPDPVLLPGYRGKHLSARQISRLLKEIAQDAGITKPVTLHMLRHSFATHLLERGVDIRVIHALLGHTKLTATARYASLATGMIAAVDSPLDDLNQTRRKNGKARPA